MDIRKDRNRIPRVVPFAILQLFTTFGILAQDPNLPPNGNLDLTIWQWYEMIGNRSCSAFNPSDGIALDEKFSYEIKVEGSTLTMTIMRQGKPDVQEIVDMSESGFEDDRMNFKTGKLQSKQFR